MLGTFVLPVEEFEAAKESLSLFDPQRPLRVSALGPKTENVAAFCEALEETAASIRSFSAHNVDLVSVVQLEMFIPHDVEIALLREARAVIGNLPAFWEAPPKRAEETIALLAELKRSSEQVHELEADLRDAEALLDSHLLNVPNFPLAGVPDGDATAKTFPITISNATPFSGNKTFTVALSKPSATTTRNMVSTSLSPRFTFVTPSTNVAIATAMPPCSRNRRSSRPGGSVRNPRWKSRRMRPISH